MVRASLQIKKNKPICYFVESSIIAEDYEKTAPFFDRSCFGERNKKKHVFSLEEGYYLFLEEKIRIFDKKNKEYSKERLLKRLTRIKTDFLTQFIVYSDLREKGYIPKTALKFGSVFRVYDKGVRPGNDHARWIVLPVSETQTLKWYDYSAQSRVAHSTRKKLLIAIVDQEHDVSYYENSWIKV